jgi:hypothetical protein
VSEKLDFKFKKLKIVGSKGPKQNRTVAAIRHVAAAIDRKSQKSN